MFRNALSVQFSRSGSLAGDPCLYSVLLITLFAVGGSQRSRNARDKPRLSVSDLRQGHRRAGSRHALEPQVRFENAHIHDDTFKRERIIARFPPSSELTLCRAAFIWSRRRIPFAYWRQWGCLLWNLVTSLRHLRLLPVNWRRPTSRKRSWLGKAERRICTLPTALSPFALYKRKNGVLPSDVQVYLLANHDQIIYW